MDCDSNGQAHRQQLFEVNYVALVKLASLAQAKGYNNSRVILVCIEADDEDWADVAEHLMPNEKSNWDDIRAGGEIPIARGTVEWAITEYLGMKVPALKSVFCKPPPDGEFLVAVLGGGGASVHLITPAQ